ncbi:LysE family translocator [Nocardioides sp. zg-536]|uniref:LysE family translocator n=1 Tax=Nocardioides faecalis TaxID=2803858 RepID=A0A939BV47_9ACTN|nr:LysE family translocator [Nocardioides faecalis]MBM9459536.1 LysE family translocator [Nocardioides faecalis]MBS4753684.1 LysE family translocator [Nocardioides faecalis]QVI58069.1 LysE family translocator [Nocardioides faecalis]
MIGVDQLLGFGIAALVVIVIPGPSVVFVVGRAVAYGQRVALATVLGNTLGLFVVMALVCAGLGVVLAESAVVFTVLKLAGAAYLVYLGVQALRHRHDLRFGDAGAAGPLPAATAVRQGFWVGVSNPKGFMIFAAMLPPFVDTGAGAAVPLQMFVLGLLAVLVGLVCDTAWGLAAGRARDWFVASERRGSVLGGLGGTSMIGLGVGLAFTGRH